MGPAIRKIIMDLRTNAIAWNPMEAFVFATASEDYNVYAFDSRQLKRPVNVHVDHVGAVTALDYAPTGREIVTGSYDKTVRIFPVDEGHSREVYHAKRMQRLTCVAWSRDNKYILSGSDEMNLRLWKAKAWEKLGVVKDRQKSSIEYSEKLKEKYASHPQPAAPGQESHEEETRAQARAQRQPGASHHQGLEEAQGCQQAGQQQAGISALCRREGQTCAQRARVNLFHTLFWFCSLCRYIFHLHSAKYMLY